MSELHVYDTTLRDGAQQEGLNLSVADKLAIAAHLDELGVGFIEGGWPGANPKDTEFFARARQELSLRHATLAAFGATRRAGTSAADDPQVRALLDSGAPVVTLVAKSHLRHVETALRTTGEENLAMVRDTVAFLRGEGRRVFLDAEHFFDGYLADRAYALEVVRTAAEAGAEVVALCDTNGGMLPPQVADVVADVLDATGVRLGIHCHNDTGCAVANSLAAVTAGATHVQGTVNGYGERTGNADLLTVVSNLQLKQGREVLPPDASRGDPDRARGQRGHQRPAVQPPAVRRGERLRAQGRAARERDQGRPRPLPAHRPDGGRQRHADARLGHGRPREHRAQGPRARLRPRRPGRAAHPGREPGQGARAAGYTFDAADASFELLLRGEVRGERLSYFDVESWRVITDSVGAGEALSEATVKLVAAGRRVVATGEGNGPVNALDHALRQALANAYPEIDKLELIDFRVRILDAAHGTDAVTRVLIETSDGTTSWETVGVAPNIVEASGRRWSTASPTACCARASRSAEAAGRVMRRTSPARAPGGGRMAG